MNVRRIVPTEMAFWFWRLLRWSYSAYFIYVGSIILGELVRGTVTPYPQPNAAAQAFSNALDASGFMNPALVASYLGGGLALIFQRTAPLGLAMLGPPVAIILLFHTVLTGMVAWGTGWAAVWLLMVWRYRKGFVPLWCYRD